MLALEKQVKNSFEMLKLTLHVVYFMNRSVAFKRIPNKMWS